MMKKYWNAFILFFCLSSVNFYSQNLVVNGDFGTFNATILSPAPLGYTTTTYIQIPYNGSVTSAAGGLYAITNEPSILNATAFISSRDHTTADGLGNMMFVDGRFNQVFWKQDPVVLQAGVTYLFTYFIKNISVNPAAGSPRTKFNPVGCTSCSLVTEPSLTTNVWQKRQYYLTPTVTQSVSIELSSVQSSAGDNFVIDDISLSPPIVPMTVSFVKTDPSCPTVNNGSIVAYSNSGVPSYTYNLTGTKTETNSTGVFTGLGPGSYVVEVIDSDAVPVPKFSSTLNLVAPTDMTLSSTASGCMSPNSSVTLTASNGVAPYTWSASTGVAISSTAAIPPSVTPVINTTYTVTSSRIIPNINLITNGDFQSSNSGFYSDFVYTDPLNQSLTQFDYGITTNPNLWNPAFISSTDRSGTGKMFVTKGATVANKTIWSQTVLVDNTNKLYTFEFYAQNAVATSFAQFRVLINGVQIAIAPLAATNAGSAGWQRISGTWSSGTATTAKIQIINTNISLAGNDFAIDDISFSTAADAKSCSLIKTVDVKVSVICNFASIPEFCSGSVAPLLSTTSPNGIVGTWTPATINNTTPGSYTFLPTAVLDACAIGQTLNTIVTSVTNPGTLSGNQNICLGLDTTFLSTVSGGTWSSSNSAIASVNSVSGIVRGVATGTATLTYTVLGKGCSDATNKITVSVTAPPNAGILSGNQNVCLGLQTTFKSTVIGGEWKSLDTSIATIDSATGEITGVTIGTTTMTYTVSGSGSCVNASETRVVTISIGSSAGILSGIQNVCIGFATIFKSTVTDGQWSSSNINIATVNTNTGEVTGAAAGTATITYKIADISGCLSAPSNLEVTVAALPNAGTLSGNQIACVGLNTTFSSTTTGGTWVSEDSFIATVDATTGEVTGVAAGSAIINYTITGIGGCTDAVALRAVTVTAPPTEAILSGTQNICATFTTPFSSDIVGGTWSSSNNAIATVNLTGEVTGVSGGTAIIKYKILGTGGCLDSTSSRNVTVFTTPNPGTLSGTQNVCIGFSPTFSSTTSGGVWSSSDATIATVDATTGILTGVSVGTAKITYTVSGLGGCPNAFVSRDITFNNDTNAGLLTGNTNFCQGLTTPLLSSISGGTWSSSDNTIATVNVVGVVTGVSAGSVTITYTIFPTQGQCIKTSFKDIEVNSSIIPTFNSVRPICYGEVLEPLSLISINGIKGNWSPNLDNLTTKTYTFTPDNDQQCAIKQELIITVKDLPEFQITGECNSKNYELSTNSNSKFSYSWLNSMSESISTTSSVNVTKSGSYSLEVVSDGCKRMKEYEVKNVSCNYPKGISPNNDEYNNFFDLENFKVKLLQIYNRFGQEVYSKNNYINEWSGLSSDGKELPDGTYYYVITLMNNDKPGTGWVYINR